MHRTISSRWLVAWATLSFSLVATACGSTTTPGDAAANEDVAADATSGPTAMQACADVATARCTVLARCSVNAIAERYGSMDACVQREQIDCVAALTAAGTNNTPMLVEVCAPALLASSCTDFLSGNTPTACTAPAGQLAMGAACAFNAQCATGWCLVPRGAACGTCGAEPVAGASCASIPCGRALECANDVCVMPGAMGASCDAGHPCGAGLSCVGSTMTTAGTCQMAVGTAGAACDPTRHTAPGCASTAGLYCAASSHTCAMIAEASAGQPCGLVGGVVTVCTGGASCERPMASTMGTCVAAALDGAACNSTTGPTCLAGARCVVTDADAGTGTCTLPTAMACH